MDESESTCSENKFCSSLTTPIKPATTFLAFTHNLPMNELSFTESANEFRSRSPGLIHTLDGMGCEGSFLQDKLSSDRDFQKATVTLFFFNFFHILPRSSPMNHENVCPSYSFSCPMSRIHLGFCTFFLFEAFRPTITIVRVTSSHIQYNHHPHSCLREDISLSPYPSLGVKNDPGNCCSSTRHFE